MTLSNHSLQDASWKELDPQELGKQKFLKHWLSPDASLWKRPSSNLTPRDWIEMGANPDHLSLLQMLLDCRLIGPQCDLISNHYQGTAPFEIPCEIEGFYQDTTHPIMVLTSLSTPRIKILALMATSGTFLIFNPMWCILHLQTSSNLIYQK